MTDAAQSRISSKRANTVLLLLSFAFGQGVMFFVQTYLVSVQNFALLSAFGTHFVFSILSLLIVDAGGITTLSRTASQWGRAEGGTAASLLQEFWSISLFRTGLAVVVIACWLIYAARAGSDFAFHYTLFSLPAYLVWAFNGAGLLDGLKRSGISGFLNAVTHLCPALALALFAGLPGSATGAMTGAALTLGVFLTTAGHFVFLARLGQPLRPVRPTGKTIAQAARTGFLMLVYTIPGQLTYRLQIIVVSLLFATEITALFLYAKQATNALAQMINFTRRVEFPYLVAALQTSSERFVFLSFYHLRLGLFAAAATVAVVIAAALVIPAWLPPQFSDAAGIVLLFAPLLLTATISSTLAHGLMARGLFARNALATIAGALALLIAVYPSARQWGILGVAMAEYVSHAVVIAVLLLLVRTTDRKNI